MNAMILDLNALKSRQQTAWGSGDYAVIGTTLQIVGESLAEACDLRWDERGPVHKAFASLSSDKAGALERDTIDLLNGLNRGGSDSLVVPSEYLEIVVTRK